MKAGGIAHIILAVFLATRPALADAPCPPKDIFTPIPEAEGVTFDTADISNAGVPLVWQRGKLGRSHYRLFPNGSGSIGEDNKMMGWRVDFVCDAKSKDCTYAGVQNPPASAMDAAKKIGACLKFKPPEPAHKKPTKAPAAEKHIPTAKTPAKKPAKPAQAPQPAKPADATAPASKSATPQSDKPRTTGPKPASGQPKTTAPIASKSDAALSDSPPKSKGKGATTAVPSKAQPEKNSVVTESTAPKPTVSSTRPLDTPGSKDAKQPNKPAPLPPKPLAPAGKLDIESDIAIPRKTGTRSLSEENPQFVLQDGSSVPPNVGKPSVPGKKPSIALRPNDVNPLGNPSATLRSPKPQEAPTNTAKDNEEPAKSERSPAPTLKTALQLKSALEPASEPQDENVLNAITTPMGQSFTVQQRPQKPDQLGGAGISSTRAEAPVSLPELPGVWPYLSVRIAAPLLVVQFQFPERPGYVPVAPARAKCWASLLPNEKSLATIQRLLLLSGFDPGPIDGRDGLRTRKALLIAFGAAAPAYSHTEIIARLEAKLCDD